MKKKDIIFLILEAIIVIFNIVISCVSGTSLVVTIMLWLLTLSLFATIVFLSSYNEQCVNEVKMTRKLYNLLLDEYFKINKELLDLQMSEQEESKISNTNNEDNTDNPHVE